MDEHPYGWFSLLPPVVAIVLAIATRRIVLSLVAGIFAGALLMAGGDVFTATEFTWEVHLWSTLIDPEKMRVFSFTLLMGAMIGVITKSGGMLGLIQLVSPWARTRRRGQLATWLLGMLIFFDDYANTILLGNTLRPICDRLKISRAKLAYLVDSTAAPVAGLALVSTWVAVEIEFISNGLGLITTPHELGGFDLFLASIPYRFYIWTALLLVPVTAILGRDFGPMLRAERQCLAGTPDPHVEEREPPAYTTPKQPAPWYYAVLPIATTLAVVVYFLYTTGSQEVCRRAADSAIAAVESLEEADSADVGAGIKQVRKASEAAKVSATITAIEKLGNLVAPLTRSPRDVDTSVFEPQPRLRDVVGAANSSLALQYGSLVGLCLAMAMPWMMRLLNTTQLLSAAGDGARVVLPAITILWCASAMSRMTTEESVGGQASETPYQFKDHRLYTAAFLTQVLSTEEPPRDQPPRMEAPRYSLKFLPTIVFVLAAMVAFCTGTSWGTMGILVPMVVPLAYAALSQNGGEALGDNPILLSCVGGVLAGAIFGDHCSPISDTTVLSSQSSGCDHLVHVWTQMPYALTAAAVSILLGTLPIGFGVSVWLLLPLQFLTLVAAVRFLGQRVDDDPGGARTAP